MDGQTHEMFLVFLPGSRWFWTDTTQEESVWWCWRWTLQNSESASGWLILGCSRQGKQSKTGRLTTLCLHTKWMMRSTHTNPLLVPELSLSKMDRRAWAPALRGMVWDLTRSLLLSPRWLRVLSSLTSSSLRYKNLWGTDALCRWRCSPPCTHVSCGPEEVTVLAGAESDLSTEEKQQKQTRSVKQFAYLGHESQAQFRETFWLTLDSRRSQSSGGRRSPSLHRRHWRQEETLTFGGTTKPAQKKTQVLFSYI